MQTAIWTLKEGRDYVVERKTMPSLRNKRPKDNILIRNFMTNGRPVEGSQWQDGIHQFLQINIIYQLHRKRTGVYVRTQLSSLYDA